MRALWQRGKEYLCLFISVFVLGLFVAPLAQEGETIYAYNIHNLGRAFERAVQLPEGYKGPFGPFGSEFRNQSLRVF